MILEITEQEQRQIYTACWNERATLIALLEKRKSQGLTNICSTSEREEILTSIIEKLKP